MIDLVTGASGRIGRHLIQTLLRNGDEVKVLVKENMIDNENVEVFYGDLLDKESLKKAVEGVDTVFHLAAMTDYLAPKEDMYKVNVVGTQNLLDVSKGKKFIYLSSTAVMGNKFKELPLNESTPCKPSSFYGKTKLEAENMVKQAGGIIVRSPDVFGPGFTEGFDFVLAGLESGQMPVIGDGKNFIQWIHINDLVQGLNLAKNLGKPGEVYIVAGKEFKTLNELLALLSKYMGVEPPKKHTMGLIAKAKAHSNVLKGKLSKERPEMIPEYVNKLTANRTFDLTKAKTELGFEPQIGYDESAKEIVEDYKSRSQKEEEKVAEEQSENEA